MLALVALLALLSPGLVSLQPDTASTALPRAADRPGDARALTPSPPLSGELCALDEFVAGPTDDPASAVATARILGTAAAEYELEPLIALVPHPNRSRLATVFDQHVQSIQRALEDAGYLLDRYWLPWSPTTSVDRSSAAQAPCASRSSDVSRGVLLFRSAPQGGQKGRLLPVLLVTETPTTGIDKPALYAALDFVLATQAMRPSAGGAPPPFLVLGPTFSGSATSLKRAIVSWSQSRLGRLPPGGFQFEIVSGSATNADSGRAIASDADYPPDLKGRLGVRFSTTVYSDEYLLGLFFHYLQNRDAAVPGTACPQRIDETRSPEILGRVALLVESNTEYGGGVLAPGALRAPVGYLKLPFPMHIAQLRAERVKAESSRKAAPEPVVDFRLQPLDLPEEDALRAGDVLPPFSKLSSRVDDLVLGNLLAAVSRSGIRYVGILATDVMDRLFLAQAVREHSPDVSLIAFGADLLYTHPRYARDLEGMLVASTYPLFTQNQVWTYPHRGSRKRIQFPTMEAEGVFNAVLVLIQREERMMDYAFPLQETAEPQPGQPRELQPPVWISAVGRGAIWPVATLCRMDKEDPLLRLVPQRAEAAAPDDRPHPHERTISTSTFFKVYAIGFVLICGLHAAAYLVISGRRPRLPLVWRLFGVFEAEPGSGRFLVQQLFVFACFLILSLVFVWITVPALLRLIVDWSPSPALVLEGAVLLAGWIALYVPILRLARTIRRSAPPRAGPLLALTFALALLPVVLLGVTLVYAFGSPLHLVRADPMEPAWLASFYLRASSLGSGLSPLLPMLFLGLALYLWSLTQLRRLRLGDSAEHIAAVTRVPGVGADGLQALERRIDALLGDNLYTLRACAGLFAAVIVFFCLSLKRLPPSMDGRYFVDLFELLLFLVVVAVVFEFCRFLLVWRALRSMLRRFAWHPLREGLQRLPKVLWSEPLLDLRRARPSLATLKAALDRWQSLVIACQAAAQATPALPAGFESFARESEPELRHSKADLEAALDQEVCAPWALGQTRLTLQQRVDAAMGRVVKLLDQVEAAPAPVRAATEDLLAVGVLGFVRYAFAQMRNLLLFSTSAVLLVLVAISSYPFQPRHLLLSLSWIVILSMVASVVLVFVQMDRDEVLSWLAKTEAGRISLSGPLLMRVVTYGVVPLLGLAAAQFPEVGRFFFFWVEPLVAAFK